jgi:hypothetical protein
MSVVHTGLVMVFLLDTFIVMVLLLIIDVNPILIFLSTSYM